MKFSKMINISKLKWGELKQISLCPATYPLTFEFILNFQCEHKKGYLEQRENKQEPTDLALGNTSHDMIKGALTFKSYAPKGGLQETL